MTLVRLTPLPITGALPVPPLIARRILLSLEVAAFALTEPVALTTHASSSSRK